MILKRKNNPHLLKNKREITTFKKTALGISKTSVTLNNAKGKPIFLTGFMGSGKTHWGKLWAAASALKFFDLDEMIEAKEKRSIKTIFDAEGENYFRQLETEMLYTFLTKQHCIVACGGGTPCYNNNMQWMNQIGTTVYFKATANDIFKRLITEQEKRPLINNLPPAELLKVIENKLKERASYYTQATIILPVNTVTTDTINTILKNA